MCKFQNKYIQAIAHRLKYQKLAVIKQDLFIQKVVNPNRNIDSMIKIDKKTKQSRTNQSTSQTYDSHVKQIQPLSKITVRLDDQEYSLSIFPYSTIKKLALKLIIMLYDNLLEDQFNDEFSLIHQKICEILLEQITRTIEKQKTINKKAWKDSLTQIINQYYQQKVILDKQPTQQKSKYFIKNYLTTLREQSKQQNQMQNISFISNQKPQPSFRLYQKGLKSIQKNKNVGKQTKQQKNKVQISYCTFHPNILKSQKKFKSKQKSNVFERLYSDADQIRTKNITKKKQIQNEQEKASLLFKYVPQINECSKQIIKLKQKQEIDIRSFLSFQKSQSFHNISGSSSKKQLNQKRSQKKFQNLCDPNFYQNRFNRTMQKLNLSKQNEFTFQPQISQGTKRITKNYPSLEKRMQIYELKKTQNVCSSPSLTLSKDKSAKKISNLVKVIRKQNAVKQQSTSRNEKSLKKQKIAKNDNKGSVRRFLDRIKTEPLSEIQNYHINSEMQNSQMQKPSIDRYRSQLFRLETDFMDEDYVFQITPKKLNIEQGKSQKAFFKDKNCSKNIRSEFKAHQIQKSYELQHMQSDQRQIQSKQEIFNRIFINLSNKKAEISDLDISQNEEIPQKIKLILEPLTRELSQMQTSLDQEEFVWSLQNLYQQLEIEKKAILLSWGLRLFKKKMSKNKIHDQLYHVKTQGSIFQLVE